MDFNEYQKRTRQTAIYPEATTASESAITYCTLGLTNEAGEVAGKLKKWMRQDDHPGLTPSVQLRHRMADELGDVLWYLARLADELKLDLGDIAEENLMRLADRKDRGVLRGDGDNR